jgi:hypothetical protein
MERNILFLLCMETYGTPCTSTQVLNHLVSSWHAEGSVKYLHHVLECFASKISVGNCELGWAHNQWYKVEGTCIVAQKQNTHRCSFLEIIAVLWQCYKWSLCINLLCVTVYEIWNAQWLHHWFYRVSHKSPYIGKCRQFLT